MPIVEIAEMRQRAGLKSELVNLKEGEFGLTLDTGEVYIGTPNLPAAQGRSLPPGTNTQILTEWGKNIEQMLNYKFLQRSVEFDSSTTPPYVLENDVADLPSEWPYLTFKQLSDGAEQTVSIERKLQERLDERVSIHSFGATGNDIHWLNIANNESNYAMDATANAFRYGTYKVAEFLHELTDETIDTNRALYIPGGTYAVNKSLLLTNNTHWIGDGKGKTKIVFNVDSLTFDDEYDNVLLKTSEYTQPENVTGDIDPYTYSNIGTDNEPRVKNIIVENITFEIRGSASGAYPNVRMMDLIRTSGVVFRNCEFIGNMDTGDININQAIGMHIDSIGSAITSHCYDIKFVGCDFKNFYRVAALNDIMVDIHFHQCYFLNNHRSITLGENYSNPSWRTDPVSTGYVNGPRHVLVTHSRFKNVAAEAIYANTSFDSSTTSDYNEYFYTTRDDTPISAYGKSGIISSYNRYENVGNSPLASSFSGDEEILQSSENPGVPVIWFASGSQYNASLGDTFSRDVTITAVNKDVAARVWTRETDRNIIMNPQDQPKIDFVQVCNALENLTYTSLIPPLELDAKNSYVIKYSVVYEQHPSLAAENRKKSGRLYVVPTSSTVEFSNDYINVGPESDRLLFNVDINGSGYIEVTYYNPVFDGVNVGARLYYVIETLGSNDI